MKKVGYWSFAAFSLALLTLPLQGWADEEKREDRREERKPPPRREDDERTPPPPRAKEDIRRDGEGRGPGRPDGERREGEPRREVEPRRDGDQPRERRPMGPPRDDDFPRPPMPREPREGPPGPPPPRDMEQLRAVDPEMADLMEKDRDLDQRTSEVASRYHRATAAEREKLKEQVVTLAGEHFAVRQQRRQLQFSRMEAELKRLRESMENREKGKQEIIQRRVDELLGNDNDRGF